MFVSASPDQFYPDLTIFRQLGLGPRAQFVGVKPSLHNLLFLRFKSKTQRLKVKCQGVSETIQAHSRDWLISAAIREY